MITGKDNLSLDVLKALKSKRKLADIAEEYRISLDQVKRLKRYSNYLNVLETYGDHLMVEKLQLLGLKGLVLSPLFKANDFESISTILSQVDDQTTREELLKSIELLKQKNARLAAFMSEQEDYKQSAKGIIEQQQSLIHRLTLKKQELLDQLPFLQKYPKDAQDFLRNYVGPYRNGFALRRRIDSGFRRALQKRDVLTLNNDYIWVIHDLDSFVDQYLHRISRGFNIEYDYERELKRAGGQTAYVSSDIDYIAVKTFHEELQEIELDLKRAEQEIEQLQEEMKQKQKEFLALQRESLHSFEEASISSNGLSERELIHHASLQTKALKWLYSQGAVACSEFTLPNKRRVDVIGYMANGQVVIIEVKASYQDYKRDSKWEEYLPYCDHFYFAMDFLPYDREIGYLAPFRQSLEVKQEDRIDHACKDPKTLQHQINRALSKRLVYGFR